MKNKPTATFLEAALAIVRKIDEVASACIWSPDAAETADLTADGIDPCSRLEVTVWKSCRNPSDVKADIERLGVECVGSGSAVEGPCYSFVPASRKE
jgi:hypothetical protein